MDEEMRIFQALNATENPDIEKQGILRVFYYGPFLNHHAIAMTLCEGTLADRYKRQNEPLSYLSVLLIFRRTVCQSQSACL